MRGSFVGMADANHVTPPEFKVRRTKDGLWYVLADWPDDGAEAAHACVSEAECHHWIATKSKGWLAGRTPPSFKN